MVDLATFNLPLLDESAHPVFQQYEQEHTKRWSLSVASADAYVFVTPEYDYFPPASLINAVQVLMREWARKPAGVVSYGGISGGPPSFNAVTGTLKTPVLAMEMTSRPGERRFYAELLTLLGAPQRPRADIAQMEQAALRIMEAIGVQVLVIDEVHNILAGSYREQRIVLNTLRFLSNRLQISLICFGVNEAREAIGGDVQLARRFEQFTLNRWAANEQFETLMVSILRNTPLRRRSVLTPKSLRRILQITEGITANIFHMINGLAIEAVESGREHITDEAVENWEPEFDAEAAFA